MIVRARHKVREHDVPEALKDHLEISLRDRPRQISDVHIHDSSALW